MRQERRTTESERGDGAADPARRAGAIEKADGAGGSAESAAGVGAILRLVVHTWRQEKAEQRRFREVLDRRLAQAWTEYDADLADGRAIVSAYGEHSRAMSPAARDAFFLDLLDSHGRVAGETARRVRRAFEETITELRADAATETKGGK